MTTLNQARQLFKARANWLGEGGRPSPHAQLRASHCFQCPYNQPRGLEELFKGAVASLVKKQIELKEHLHLKVEGEEKLHVCGLCGCFLPLKVHVPLKVARDNTPDWKSYPSLCWLKYDSLT